MIAAFDRLKCLTILNIDYKHVGASTHIGYALAHQADMQEMSIILQTILAVIPLLDEEIDFKGESHREQEQ